MKIEYYTIKEFAKKMNVHRNTVHRWVRDGKVKVREIGGNKRIVFKEDEE